MKQYITHDPWRIVEDGFHSDYSEISESLFSLGNGRMGQRANFEEGYSGKSLLGNYYAGVYYPDKTRVGWWKNGYPEYFAKVLNGINWIGMRVLINDKPLDLDDVKHSDFQRVLDMRSGLLQRSFIVHPSQDQSIRFTFERFCSMDDKDLGAVKVNIQSENFSGKIELKSFQDFDVRNQDSNYDEKFWIPVEHDTGTHYGFLHSKTKKTGFHVSSIATHRVSHNGTQVDGDSFTSKEDFASQKFHLHLEKDDEIIFEKLVLNLSSLYVAQEEMKSEAKQRISEVKNTGYDQLKRLHEEQWHKIWELADIEIEGDVSAQQGIRFNIFQLFQTYTGEDPRLNIGPKGFTGEKYGGSTYWDTEAYCIPFYLGTADQSVGHQLLKYRYLHLDRAIENAGKLGFTKGAALYPMVTMNGEECHNEWEITFEEIHRNGAIAYAIFNYIRYTGDDSYLYEGGAEVLIAIARFWAQRVNYSEQKGKYVILGITGPNEYENNVDNNWYTNYIARWCLQYTLDCREEIGKKDYGYLEELNEKLKWDPSEAELWKEIIGNIYLPESKELGIFLQQENYLDKEQILVADLDPEHLPINQNWSWDRILRSCYIKQADVLQGIYFFEEDFDIDTIRNNFLYYEPRTVHESSLSPCVHSILASSLDMKEKAYEMYLRTARLDLDDYNNDTEDGCHITSMAGTWMAVVEGFAGLRIKEGKLNFHPSVPVAWDSFRFKLNFRQNLLEIKIDKAGIEIVNLKGPSIEIGINGKKRVIEKAHT